MISVCIFKLIVYTIETFRSFLRNYSGHKIVSLSQKFVRVALVLRFLYFPGTFNGIFPL